MQCEEINVQAIIHGETGHCARIRCGEHHRDLKNKAPRSNLYEHIVAIHDGDTDTKFKYEVVKVFQKGLRARLGYLSTRRMSGKPPRLYRWAPIECIDTKE